MQSVLQWKKIRESVVGWQRLELIIGGLGGASRWLKEEGEFCVQNAGSVAHNQARDVQSPKVESENLGVSMGDPLTCNVLARMDNSIHGQSLYNNSVTKDVIVKSSLNHYQSVTIADNLINSHQPYIPFLSQPVLMPVIPLTKHGTHPTHSASTTINCDVVPTFLPHGPHNIQNSSLEPIMSPNHLIFSPSNLVFSPNNHKGNPLLPGQSRPLSITFKDNQITMLLPTSSQQSTIASSQNDSIVLFTYLNPRPMKFKNKLPQTRSQNANPHKTGGNRSLVVKPHIPPINLTTMSLISAFCLLAKKLVKLGCNQKRSG